MRFKLPRNFSVSFGTVQPGGKIVSVVITYTEGFDALKVQARGESLKQALENVKNEEIADFIAKALTSESVEANLFEV